MGGEMEARMRKLFILIALTVLAALFNSCDTFKILSEKEFLMARNAMEIQRIVITGENYGGFGNSEFFIYEISKDGKTSQKFGTDKSTGFHEKLNSNILLNYTIKKETYFAIVWYDNGASTPATRKLFFYDSFNTELDSVTISAGGTENMTLRPPGLEVAKNYFRFYFDGSSVSYSYEFYTP